MVQNLVTEDNSVPSYHREITNMGMDGVGAVGQLWDRRGESARHRAARFTWW